MNTRTNPADDHSALAFARLDALLNESFREKHGVEVTEEQFVAAAAAAIDYLADFLAKLDQYPEDDYRSVDVALLRWCVAYGKTDPTGALTDCHPHGPDAPFNVSSYFMKEEVGDAKTRLESNDKWVYDWHKSGKAAGINRQYAY